MIKEMREIAGMADNIGIHTTMTVEEFEAGLKKLANIKPEEAFAHLDEAMKYFNHKIVEGSIVQISDKNCVNVVQAVEEFLRTGKIRIVEPSKIQDIFKLEKIYKRSFLQYKIPLLKNVMNERERGIIYGYKGPYIPGHVFNVVKKDGVFYLLIVKQ